MPVATGVAAAPIPVCLLNDTRVDRHHGCERVMGAIEALLARENMEVIARTPAHADWRTHPGMTQALRRARLVLVNGEGTLHHARPEARRLLEVGEEARSLGIPAVLVNTGWEANGTELGAMARGFAIIAARDTASARELREAGCDCEVVPDLSLYLPLGTPAAGSDATGPIAFTDSVDRLKSLDIDRCRRQCEGQFLSILFPRPGSAGYLRFLREGMAAADALSPGRLARLVALRHRLWQASTRSTDDFMRRLAGARFLVSGRFHACTLALLTRTPFVGTASNTGKIAALVQDAGLEAWRANMDLSPSSIMEAASRPWSETEARSITEYIAVARRGAERLFGRIGALA